jgi:ELWxxDGT repeat protein
MNRIVNRQVVEMKKSSFKFGILVILIWAYALSGYAQTSLLKDIQPGSDQSYPEDLKAVGNKLFFQAEIGDDYGELWVSDGTTEGTIQVSQIAGPYTSADVEDMTAFNGKLLFSAYDSENGRELHISDGTQAGTYLIKNIAPSYLSADPDDFAVMGDRMFFEAEDGYYPDEEHGDELWVTDGTSSGTHLFKDLYPGQHDQVSGDSSNNRSYPRHMYAYQGKLYFSASNDTEGREPWISDGTAEGTHLLKDIALGRSEYDNPLASNPYSFFGFEGKVLFVANDTTSDDRQLWVTDGTTEGTKKIQQLSSSPSGGEGFGFHGDPVVYHDACYFINGGKIWRTDGTEAGTAVAVEPDLASYSDLGDKLLVLNDTLYFFDTYNLWRSDGTPSGTEIVVNGTFNEPDQPVVFKDRIYYVATDYYYSSKPGRFGTELWMTDGTPEGTLVVKDVFPGVYMQGTEERGGNNANPDELTIVGDKLYFIADTDEYGEEVWYTEGLPERTVQLEVDSLVPAELPDLDLYFDFSQVDTSLEVTTLRNPDIAAADLQLPEGWKPAMNGTWTVTPDTVVNFEASVCFDLEALNEPSVNRDQLTIFKRESANQAWSEQTVQQDQTDDGQEILCATGVTSFSTFAVAQNTNATAIDEEHSETPQQVRLDPAYPNPFNPTATIKYSLPEAKQVKLEVFDMLGRHIVTLVDRRQSAGSHTATLDAKDWASGTYIYRLTAGEIVRNKKMTLLK